MILKTGRKCTWEDLAIGEVFAWNGCWAIGIKITVDEGFWFASDHPFTVNDCEIDECMYLLRNYYKLSESVQRLWKEE